jgi:hypothetical protein
MTKFASMPQAEFDALSGEDQKLVEYLNRIYRNLNKDIKGRGVGRRVAPTRQSPKVISNASQYQIQQHVSPSQQHTPPMQQHTPPMRQHTLSMQHQASAMHQGSSHMSQPGLEYCDSMPNMGMPRSNNQMMIRDPRGYEIFGVDHQSLPGNGPATGSTENIYVEDQARDLAFQDRMY